ncbi:NAD/NADP octopine/nopaline dehydrogenase [Crinalium epipsammum PCC 9333]|uniref:NAD/NADP octopine/nopaline dehydrogenase n=1 Tax=Crinalium epipsammum PCC 9333 TaxID=1173022 RepID=K9VU96_9CYAN|nr:NAD/NADP octopine/nopaline dehydrogenase family protein [Crinalium epipsammum]AFZ11678.1 NAD/NADP octopine/nopaline dehydrogenase [Crinalium epipsammum PCC 9333]
MLQTSYLVVGKGHIGLASALYLSAQGYTVYLFSRRHSIVAKTKTIHSIGAVSPGSYPVAACSNNLDELAALNGGQLPLNVLICCRGQDIEPYARILAKYINPQMNVLVLCASRFAGWVFCKVLTRLGIAEAQLPAVADVNNTPFVSRGNTEDQVRISTLTNKFFVAAQNRTMTNRIVVAYEAVFSNLCPAASVLEINLNKVNDIIHLPLLLVSLARWESGEDYNIYHKVGARTVGLIDHLDGDRMAVGEALGVLNLIDIKSHYQIAYGTKGPSLYEHMQQLGAYSSTTLCNPHHRYLVEDLPYGCFPLQVLARLAGVETPFLDSCITIGSKFLDIPLPWTAEFLELERQLLSQEL